MSTATLTHKVVSNAEWLEVHRAFLITDGMAWVRHHDRYNDTLPFVDQGAPENAAHACYGVTERHV